MTTPVDRRATEYAAAVRAAHALFQSLDRGRLPVTLEQLEVIDEWTENAIVRRALDEPEE